MEKESHNAQHMLFNFSHDVNVDRDEKLGKKREKLAHKSRREDVE